MRDIPAHSVGFAFLASILAVASEALSGSAESNQ
jgi:hypothetical protein